MARIPPVISASAIPSLGRFGNQITAYVFARAYAEKYGAQLWTPPWVGEKVFNISHPRISQILPPMTGPAETGGITWGAVNVDLGGYYWQPCHFAIMGRAKIQSWLTVQERWRKMFPARGGVVAHLRRGDYLQRQETYAVVGKESYIRAARQFGYNPDEILWVTEETQQPHVQLDAEGVGFIPDFLRLMNADVILRANSGFSWWAASLSNARVLSPLVGDTTGALECDFVEGNYPKGVGCGSDIHLPP